MGRPQNCMKADTWQSDCHEILIATCLYPTITLWWQWWWMALTAMKTNQWVRRWIWQTKRLSSCLCLSVSLGRRVGVHTCNGYKAVLCMWADNNVIVPPTISRIFKHFVHCTLFPLRVILRPVVLIRHLWTQTSPLIIHVFFFCQGKLHLPAEMEVRIYVPVHR